MSNGRSEDVFYFIMEGELEGGYPLLRFHPRNRPKTLKMVLYPYRWGEKGLFLRVEVWNLSSESKLVFPLCFPEYYPEFRGGNGQPIRGEMLPPILTRLWRISEMIKLAPYSALMTNYMFPTFYDRVRGHRRIQVQIRVSRDYLIEIKNKKQRRGTFKLSSGWVDVPAP
jgi:hypothetical protein